MSPKAITSHGVGSGDGALVVPATSGRRSISAQSISGGGSASSEGCADPFTRSGSGSWLSGPMGAWQTFPAEGSTAMSVDGDEGVWQWVSGQGNRNYVLVPLTLPVELLVKVRTVRASAVTFGWKWWLNITPLNFFEPGYQYVNANVEAFGAEGGMRLELREWTDGATEGSELTGANYVPASPDPFNRVVWQRILFTATSVRQRFWFDGDAEPGAWDQILTYLAAFDTAAVDIGFEGFGSSGSNQVYVDHLTIVQGCGGAPPALFDELDSAVGPIIIPNDEPVSDFDLGSARPGRWYNTFAWCPGFNLVPTDGAIEIDGEALVVALIGGAGTFTMELDTADANDDLYEIEMAFEFDTIPGIPTSGGLELNSRNDIEIQLSVSPSAGLFGQAIVSRSYLGGFPGGWYAQWFGANNPTSLPWTPVAGQVYHMKVQYDRANAMSRAKLWSEAESEPGWMIESAAPFSDPPSGDTLNVHIDNTCTGNADDPGEYDRLITWKIHWIRDSVGGFVDLVAAASLMHGSVGRV